MKEIENAKVELGKKELENRGKKKHKHEMTVDRVNEKQKNYYDMFHLFFSRI